jgi:hypothetical protein
MKQMLAILGLMVGIVPISYRSVLTEKTTIYSILNPAAIAQESSNPGPPELIPYRMGDKWGFCDANKKLIIQVRYEEVLLFTDGLARVKLNGKYGFINKSGTEVIPPKYDNASIFFRDELPLVKLNGKYGFIDMSGTEVIPCKYDDAVRFSVSLQQKCLTMDSDINARL